MSSLVVSFAGTLKESQFDRVQKALLPIWMRWYVFVPSVLICFVQIGAGWEHVWQEPLRAVPDLLWSLPVLAACAVIIKIGRRRAWKNYQRFHGAVSGHLGSDGLEWKTEATTTSLPWVKTTGHRVSRDLALLYYAPRCAFFFPREFFLSDQDWSLFQQLLGEHSKPI
jgi:hypothetical protein